MELLNLLAAPGLNTLQRTMVNNWIGPAFLMVVAGFAIKFMISRQFRELAGFLAIAAIVALLVFNAGSLFGENGIFTNIADSFSGQLESGAGGMIDILRVFTFK